MVFEDDEIEIDRHTTANDIDGWDSMSHMTLLMAIEEDFEIEFEEWEVIDLSDVGELIDLITEKLSE
ncbi:MAG TPA: acyl carrier protein [Chloroflexi bacterium]|nr:acyl carrier protein [Chloroflexota bacterium]